MAKKKNKQANAKKKLAALLAKMEKKKALIARQSKKLKALKDKAAKFIEKNPELKPVEPEPPKRATSRRKKVAS